MWEIFSSPRYLEWPHSIRSVIIAFSSWNNLIFMLHYRLLGIVNFVVDQFLVKLLVYFRLSQLRPGSLRMPQQIILGPHESFNWMLKLFQGWLLLSNPHVCHLLVQILAEGVAQVDEKVHLHLHIVLLHGESVEIISS